MGWIAAGLTKRYLTGAAGLTGGGLSQVDYVQLLSNARRHKETANCQMEKMQQLSQQGRESKEAGLLRAHREVWLQELQRLAKERGMVETELEQWRAALLQGCREEEEGYVKNDRATSWQWVEEVMEWEAKLTGERERFERDTLLPVRQLVGKLKCWVKARESAEAEQVGLPQSNVASEVNGVKRELRRVWGELEEECVSLCSYLAAARSAWDEEWGRGEREKWRREEEEREGGKEEEDREQARDREAEVAEGGEECGREENRERVMECDGVAKCGGRETPTALQCCSSPELRTSLTQEFAALDAHYHGVLEQLQDKHREALR